MEHALNFEYILNSMSDNYGLAGIFANSGFGKTTLMMQIIDEINKRKDGVAVVMSNDCFNKENWIKQMQRMSLSTERVVVNDMPLVSHIDVYNHLIKLCNIEKKNVNLVCIDSLELLNPESIRKLREISHKFKVLILVNGGLTRDSGDYDPNLRPELYTITAFRNYMHGNGNQALEYDFLALLHRNHNCDRGIGTAHRYDIQSQTELIIKRNWDCHLGSAFIEWDDDDQKFKY